MQPPGTLGRAAASRQVWLKAPVHDEQFQTYGRAVGPTHTSNMHCFQARTSRAENSAI